MDQLNISNLEDNNFHGQKENQMCVSNIVVGGHPGTTVVRTIPRLTLKICRIVKELGVPSGTE